MRQKFPTDSSEIFIETDDILRVAELRDGCVVFMRGGGTHVLHCSAAYVHAFLPPLEIVTRPGSGMVRL
jgi:hypothetical protein